MKNKCIVPDCNNTIYQQSKISMCFRHTDFTHFLVWMLPQILDIKEKPKEQKIEEKKEVQIWTPDSGPSGMIR